MSIPRPTRAEARPQASHEDVAFLAHDASAVHAELEALASWLGVNALNPP